MAVTSTGVFGQTPRLTNLTFVNADGTGLKTILIGGTNGTKVIGGFIASTDPAAQTMRLWINDGVYVNLLGTVNIAAVAGSDAGVTPSQKLFDLVKIPGFAFDQFGNPFFYLQSGHQFRANVGVAVTALKSVYVTVISVDF